MKDIVVFIDSGDTLIDESSQVYDDRGIVQRAEFIEGAKELLEYFSHEHVRVCLVADGEWESFENIYKDKKMRHVFEGWVVSERVGVQKPNRQMFDEAMKAMQLTSEDKDRIIMVGNNLKKDIAGANLYGISSVWLDWSPRYFHEMDQPEWNPDYTIHQPKELINLYELLVHQ